MQLYLKTVWDHKRIGTPILLENFKWGFNQQGFFVINFDTKNHKYLDINLNGSTNYRITDDKQFWTQILTIETQETYKTKNCDLPAHSMEFYIEAENLKEKNLLDGSCLVVSSKWQYELVVVPYKYMYLKDSQVKGSAKRVFKNKPGTALNLNNNKVIPGSQF